MVYDVGIMLWRRSQLSKRTHVCRYGLADASPQGGRDWFIIKTSCIHRETVVQVMEAVHTLASDAAMDAYWRASDEPELADEAQIASQRTDLFGIIKKSLWTLTSPPVALGQGMSGIADKVAAFVYAHVLECGWDHLGEVLASFCSFTSDMGTEVAMNDFAALDWTQLLPRYIRMNRIMCDSEDAHAANAAENPCLFSVSMPVAGVLHIVANATRDLNRALPGWDSFYTGLKVFYFRSPKTTFIEKLQT